MSSLGNYFLLYANCILVSGAKRSIICDLQRSTYVIVSNEFCAILKKLEHTTINHYFKNNIDCNKVNLVKDLKYLDEIDFGHFCSSPSSFPKLNLTFHTPFKIEDCIIELSIITFKHIKKIIKSLTILGCQVLELRAYDRFSLEKLKTILLYLEGSPIRNVELYLKFDEEIELNEYLQILKTNQIIGRLIIHSFNGNLKKVADSRLLFTKQAISSSKCCGSILKDNFKINISSFTESFHFNSCLNRKVSINSNGIIKNCPSLKNNFGSIENTRIEDVIEKKAFKKLWKLNKDSIKICMDCEFRYICSDCRAFTEDPNDIYSKPLKCGYNPYTNEWKTWHELSEKNEGKVFYQFPNIN